MEINRNRVENKIRVPCSSRKVVLVIAPSILSSGKKDYSKRRAR
jgi:hypothetical protein